MYLVQYKLVQRIFKIGEIQNSILTPDKKLNILVYETHFHHIQELQYYDIDPFWPSYNKTNKINQYIILNTESQTNRFLKRKCLNRVKTDEKRIPREIEPFERASTYIRYTLDYTGVHKMRYSQNFVSKHKGEAFKFIFILNQYRVVRIVLIWKNIWA